jgi:hypothetical protein
MMTACHGPPPALILCSCTASCLKGNKLLPALLLQRLWCLPRSAGDQETRLSPATVAALSCMTNTDPAPMQR